VIHPDVEVRIGVDQLITPPAIRRARAATGEMLSTIGFEAVDSQLVEQVLALAKPPFGGG
jgi:hypothetical protein